MDKFGIFEMLVKITKTTINACKLVVPFVSPPHLMLYR